MALAKLKVGHYKGPWGKVAAKHDALVDWLAGAIGKQGITIKATDGALVVSYSPQGPVDKGSDVSITSVGGGGTVPNPLPVPNGGTNITSFSVGDLLYASASTTLAKRAIASNGAILMASGGVPVWSNAGYFEKTIGICESNSVTNYIFLVRT